MATVISDNFNRADSASLGSSWNEFDEFDSGIQIRGGAAGCFSSSAFFNPDGKAFFNTVLTGATTATGTNSIEILFRAKRTNRSSAGLSVYAKGSASGFLDDAYELRWIQGDANEKPDLVLINAGGDVTTVFTDLNLTLTPTFKDFKWTIETQAGLVAHSFFENETLRSIAFDGNALRVIGDGFVGMKINSTEDFLLPTVEGSAFLDDLFGKQPTPPNLIQLVTDLYSSSTYRKKVTVEFRDTNRRQFDVFEELRASETYRFSAEEQVRFVSGSVSNKRFTDMTATTSRRFKATGDLDQTSRYRVTALTTDVFSSSQYLAQVLVDTFFSSTYRNTITTDLNGTSTIRATVTLDNRDVRINRANANEDLRWVNAIKFKLETRLDMREESQIRDGFRIFLDGSFVGFIDRDDVPLELTGIAMSAGRHEVEARPAEYFWEPRVPESVWVGTIDGAGNLKAAVPDAIENLRATVFRFVTNNVELFWQYETRFGSVDPEEFAVWTDTVTPVDVSGAPDTTVDFLQDGAAHAFLTLTASRFVAVRARTSTLDGPVSEIFVTIPPVPDSPDNQFAIDLPPSYVIP